MRNVFAEAEEFGARFRELGDLALARHAARHGAQPKRPAATYLRVALLCVRELAHYARFVPRLCGEALDLLARVDAAAHDAEAASFAAGGNSAPYIAVLALVAGWRIKLSDIQANPTQAPGPSRRADGPIPFDAPLPTPLAHPPTRRFVSPNQGGRDKGNGHANRRAH